MEKFAKPGDFCPNKACPDYSQLQISQSQENIFASLAEPETEYSATSARAVAIPLRPPPGRFSFVNGPPSTRSWKPWLCWRKVNRISSLSRAKGFKEDTILAWLRQAAHHAEQVEEVLMAEFKVKRGQLDALWAYVGHKGQKKLSRDD